MGINSKINRKLKTGRYVDLETLRAIYVRERVRSNVARNYKIPKNAKCKECGSRRNLTRHHTNGLKDRYNIVILCQKCHDKTHNV